MLGVDCGGIDPGSMHSEVAAKDVFGVMPDGEIVGRYTLSHGGDGIAVQVVPLGATITSLRAPDKAGKAGEVTLGFTWATPYHNGQSPYFGCVAGRVANRIAKGKFSLDGKEYTLATNNGPNHLHGGVTGFDKRNWRCIASSPTAVTFELDSADGEEGYPGALKCAVTYSLPSPSVLRMEYAATTSAPTPVNLTNHTYWNLKDAGKSAVVDHELELAADFYTPVDDTSIPTGEIRPVAGAMDLRAKATIAAHGLADADNGNGYDHNWVLGAPAADGLRPVARVYEPTSGRTMVVRTDQPGVQFYTGNYLDGDVGRPDVLDGYGKHSGFCLETQHFPDAVNQPSFPPVWLRPGETYSHVTEHTFGASDTAPAGAY